MAMIECRELRETPRVPFPEPAPVRIPLGWEVRLLDLSLKGARIEHMELLQPGTSCNLELPALLGSLILPARVVWCTIIGAEANPEGEQHLRSHSGLVFDALTVDQRSALADSLHQLVERTA
jgi:hypothetical protein